MAETTQPDSNPAPASGSAGAAGSPAHPVSGHAPLNAAAPAPGSGASAWTGIHVLSELARSPRSTVSAVRRDVEQDIVAAKAYDPSLCDSDFVKELPRRSEQAFLLEHKGLVRCLGCVVERAGPLLLMEYAPGEPLAKVLKRGVALPLEQALRVALQCATALRYAASRGCPHGRFHPSDVLLGPDTARVLGAGLGDRHVHAVWSSPFAYPFEPLAYAAPEAMPSQPRLAANEAVTAADVYALGAVLAHMLLGEPPFAGRDEEALVIERRNLGVPLKWPPPYDVEIPAPVRELVERMLAPGAGLRPTYSDVIVALNGALNLWERQHKKDGAVSGAPAGSAASALAASVARGGSNPRDDDSDSVTAVALLPVVTPPRTAPAEPSRLSAVYNTMLILVTAAVFLLALGLAARTFLNDTPPAAATPGTAPQSALPAQPAVAAVAAVPAKPAVAAVTAPAPAGETPAAQPVAALSGTANGLNTADYAAATRQLEVLQELLKDGEITHTAALRRRLLAVADKAGRASPTGVKALLLADEVEESLTARPAHAQPALAGGAAAVTPAAPAAPAAPDALPTPPAPVAKTAPPAVDPAQQAAKREEFLAAIRAARDLAAQFRYAEVNIELGRIAALALADDRRLAEEFAQVMKEEQDLIQRCRARLIEQIQRDPQHLSPLQIFPRRNDPNGDDIIDFDSSGLKIAVKRTSGPPEVKVKAWSDVNPRQAFALLQLLAPEKSNAQDQMGLAAFCFSRGLLPDMDACLTNAFSTPAGREQAEPFARQLKDLVNALGLKKP